MADGARARTHIGYGSPHKQDTAAAHGEPLGPEEARQTKERLGWPAEPPFHVPPEALDHFRQAIARGKAWQADWEARFDAYAAAYPDLAAEFRRVMRGQLPPGWDRDLPAFTPDRGPLATRVASGQALNVLASRMPKLMGGAADLAPSTHTIIEGAGNFEAASRAGRNMHFGIREHAMGAILNGMALHRGLLPYGATFLIFSDYLRPPMRLAAMNGLPVLRLHGRPRVRASSRPVATDREGALMRLGLAADHGGFALAFCGSGVGASIAANKVLGVRAGLIHDVYSACQGVEDDNMNILCMGGRVIGSALARELIDTFVAARFSGAGRHRRRLAKVAALEETS